MAEDRVVRDATPLHSPQFFHKVTKVMSCLCPVMAAGSGAHREGVCRSHGAKRGLQQAMMLSERVSEMQ